MKTPEQWIEDNIDLDTLFKEATGAREGFIEEGEGSEYYNFDVPNYEYWMFDMVSGSYGQFQTEAICEAFGMKVERDEDGDYIGAQREDFENLIWEYESFAEKVSNLLTEKYHGWYKEKYDEEICGSFGFGFLEFDSSYGLIFWEDAGNIEQEREDYNQEVV